MSKLSFRARQLDASKPMPVLKADEIPDVPDFAAINRAVPQMPTGMEKEEESEHHLQRALSAQQAFGSVERLVIPIPDIEDVGEVYEKLYAKKARDFKPPKQYIHVQPFGMDQEIPDYDMDSEDELWLNKQAKNLKMEVTSLKFENMMDRLEKGSGQTVVSLQDAKALLKEDDDLTIAVYDYWLNKRLRLQHPLIPSVKTEKRDGSTTSNPYVAFRRRTEKMQTRKNRKNDEASYEKMLKLKRDLTKALTILEMMKRREKSKKELLKLTVEVVDKRYQMADWDAKSLNEALALRHKMPTFIPMSSPYMPRGDWSQKDEANFVRKKREYRKRKHKHQQQQSSAQPSSVQLPRYSDLDALQQDAFSSDDEILSPPPSVSDQETEDDPDGVYAFKRKSGCCYHAPILGEGGNDVWGGGVSEAPLRDDHLRFNLSSLNHPKRCVGYVRRRRGRGGRILLDRGFSTWDDALTELDLTPSGMPADPVLQEYYAHISDSKILHFRPSSPVDDSAPSVIRCVTPEFSFHSHQEQLLQMQQEQQQQQALLLTPSPLLEPSSSLTLDASSAQFAASAVCSTDSSHGNPASPAVEVVIEETTPTSVKCNGPSVECAASSCFSTSPAANVLQLNFPLTPSTPLQSATPDPVLTSSSLCATTVMTPAIATEAVAPGTPPVLKIAATPGAQNNALPKNHGTEVKTIVHDQVVAMEVT